MSKIHVLKRVVVMFAFAMFVYQTTTAVNKYLDSPTVDLEETTDWRFDHRPRYKDFYIIFFVLFQINLI